MSEKKSRFVSYQLITDLFASLIFAFSVLTLVRMAVLYEGVIDLRYRHLFSVVILAEIFVFVRRLRIKLIPMVLLHILPIAGYLFAMYGILTLEGRRGIPSSLIYLGFMATLNLIYSMFWRFKLTSISSVTHDLFVASMALHLILVIISRGSLRQSVMLNVFLIVCAYLIARQLYTFDTKYYHNTQSGTQAVKQAKQQNYLTIFFISGGIVLALLLLTTIPISSITSSLRSIFVMIGRFFSRVLPEESEFEEETMEYPESSEGGGGEPVFVQILFVLFSVVIVVAFLIAIFKAFCMFVQKFHMEGPPDISKGEEDAVVDIIEEIFEEEESHSSEKDFGEGYEREIRKKYYKTVQKAIRSGTRIDPSYTPEQIETALKENGEPSISELTSQYESVRYSQKKE
ncbi:MAG: hypothetical protein J5636_04880 [Clostridiales bacterium]|nr:hypothetical protein [Clostridiales bacterium]